LESLVGAFRASGVPDRREEFAQSWHKQARLPVGKIDRRETAVLDARII
jgi:hypothetical protein